MDQRLGVRSDSKKEFTLNFSCRTVSTTIDLENLLRSRKYSLEVFEVKQDPKDKQSYEVKVSEDNIDRALETFIEIKREIGRNRIDGFVQGGQEPPRKFVYYKLSLEAEGMKGLDKAAYFLETMHMKKIKIDAISHSVSGVFQTNFTQEEAVWWAYNLKESNKDLVLGASIERIGFFERVLRF